MADRPGTSACFRIALAAARRKTTDRHQAKERQTCVHMNQQKEILTYPHIRNGSSLTFMQVSCCPLTQMSSGRAHGLSKIRLSKTAENTTDIGNPVNVEKVMQLKPDLIVLMKDDQYEKLSKIAPTIVIPLTPQRIRKIRSAYSATLPGRRIKPKALWQTSTKGRSRSKAPQKRDRQRRDSRPL